MLHETDFEGSVTIAYPAVEARPKFEQRARLKQIEDGSLTTRELQCNCLVALAAKQAKFELDPKHRGETLTVYNKLTSFGVETRTEQDFLTITATYSGDGKRYTLRLLGKMVPPRLVSDSVKHDLGKRIFAHTETIDLSRFVITPVPEKHIQPRDHAKEAAARGPRDDQHKNTGKTAAKRSFARKSQITAAH